MCGFGSVRGQIYTNEVGQRQVQVFQLGGDRARNEAVIREFEAL